MLYLVEYIVPQPWATHYLYETTLKRNNVTITFYSYSIILYIQGVTILFDIFGIFNIFILFFF